MAPLRALMKVLLPLLWLGNFPHFAAASAQIYRSKYRSYDSERVMKILFQMTMREKIREGGHGYNSYWNLLGFKADPFTMARFVPDRFKAHNAFQLSGNQRFGIKGLTFRDGPKGLTCKLHGLWRFPPPCPAGGQSPMFPQQSLRAATWDVALEEEFGAHVGQIAQQLDVKVALLPSIDVITWLNQGRGQESYGEDSFFNGRMGGGVVRGIQSKGVMAAVKHFFAQGLETRRWRVSANMDKKTMHEVYLRQWAMIVAESSPEFIMTAQNRVQGNYTFMDPKFIWLLRNKFGFEGSIVADWASTGPHVRGYSQQFDKSPSAALKAGVDVEMPVNHLHVLAARELATCTGSNLDLCLTNHALDSSVARIIRSKLRYDYISWAKKEKKSKKKDTELVDAAFQEVDPFGQLEDEEDEETDFAKIWTYFDSVKHNELSLKIARRGIVLLKNYEAFLPKIPANISSVVVLGSADKLETGDQGSSHVVHDGDMITVLQGLQDAYGAEKVTFLNGSFGDEEREMVIAADLVILDVGFDKQFEGERYAQVGPILGYLLGMGTKLGGDRQYLTLHQHDTILIDFISSLNPNVIVAISSGQVTIVEDFINKVPAVLWLGYPGPMGGRAFAEIISGAVCPSGRMTSATPFKAEDWFPNGTALEPFLEEDIKYPYVHGFKHMWAASIRPRFPMGYGLSYTMFLHSPPFVIPALHKPFLMTLYSNVTNIGKMRGIETVQVYVICMDCKIRRLPILLVGFDKVHLDPGETKTVSVAVNSKDFAVYDGWADAWVLEAGNYTLLTGPWADLFVMQPAYYTVPFDIYFDYEGADIKTEVPGLWYNCTQWYTWYRCVPKLSFNQRDWADSVRIALKWAGIVAFFYFIHWLRPLEPLRVMIKEFRDEFLVKKPATKESDRTESDRKVKKT